jgi:hypothetical protein
VDDPSLSLSKPLNAAMRGVIGFLIPTAVLAALFGLAFAKLHPGFALLIGLSALIAVIAWTLESLPLAVVDGKAVLRWPARFLPNIGYAIAQFCLALALFATVQGALLLALTQLDDAYAPIWAASGGATGAFLPMVAAGAVFAARLAHHGPGTLDTVDVGTVATGLSARPRHFRPLGGRRPHDLVGLGL